MATIHIRRNTGSNDRIGSVIDNSYSGTDNGNADDSNVGRQDTIESDNDDIGPTNNDNVIGEPVAGNSTRRAFNPDDYEVVNGQGYVNPTTAVNGSDNGSSKRRKRSDAGIKRGTRTRKGNDSETTKDLKSLLLTVHYGLASFTHSPKLKITEQEAEQLANASYRVMQLYDVPLLSEKQRAWFNLVFVASCVYLPRFRKDKVQTTEQQNAKPETSYYNPPKQPISINEAYSEHVANVTKMKQ